MPKAQPVEVIDLPELRSLDINEMFDEMDALDCPIDLINERLILDGAYGYQHATEGILNHEKFYDITDDEYAACDAGIQAAMRAVNATLRRMNVDYEIVEVDLAESMGFMLVAKDATPKQAAKNIKKGKI